MSLDYTARCPHCHGLVWIAAERLSTSDPKSLAKDMAMMVREGMSIERITTEEFRAGKGFGHTDDCTHPSLKRNRKTPKK